MKTTVTRELEQYVYELYVKNKKSVYGCSEVKVGVGIQAKTHIVDYLIYDRNKNEYRAYEIKSSLADFNSASTWSFVGHKNYFVMTRELYDNIQRKIPFNIGVVVLGEGVVKRSSNRTLSTAEQVLLLESLMRSLHREIEKWRSSDG